MSRFQITALTPIGLQLVRRLPLSDARGALTRIFGAEDLSAAGWAGRVEQINHTFTLKRGTVRGLHFQHPPYEEMKLVSCIRGEVWDVAVDIRAGSPTFLHWCAERLSLENGKAMLIPEGFAHGFQTLTADAEMLYCHSAPYVPEAEAGLNPFDDRLAIAWPLPVTEISDRDRQRPPLSDAFTGLVR